MFPLQVVTIQSQIPFCHVQISVAHGPLQCKNIPTITKIQKSEGMAQGIRGDRMAKLMTILFQAVSPGSFKKGSSFIGTKNRYMVIPGGKTDL
jgi:hypothetical protein